MKTRVVVLLLAPLRAATAARRLDECQDTYSNCAAYVAAGHTCEASFCATCEWVGQCDAFCGVCEACVDAYEHCDAFLGTSQTSCGDLFCAACEFPNYCDASCGFCYVPPTASPTPASSASAFIASVS